MIVLPIARVFFVFLFNNDIWIEPLYLLGPGYSTGFGDTKSRGQTHHSSDSSVLGFPFLCPLRISSISKRSVCYIGRGEAGMSCPTNSLDTAPYLISEVKPLHHVSSHSYVLVVRCVLILNQRQDPILGDLNLSNNTTLFSCVNYARLNLWKWMILVWNHVLADRKLSAFRILINDFLYLESSYEGHCYLILLSPAWFCCHSESSQLGEKNQVQQGNEICMVCKSLV